MANFLIRTARDLLVASWFALIFGAYLAIDEANRLADASSITVETRYILIGATALAVVVYTALCGGSLVMFGIHDRLAEISDSFARVADRICSDEWTGGTRAPLTANSPERVLDAETNSIEPPTENSHLDGQSETQSAKSKGSWWGGASFGEKAIIIFICLIPIIIWMTI